MRPAQVVGDVEEKDDSVLGDVARGVTGHRQHARWSYHRGRAEVRSWVRLRTVLSPAPQTCEFTVRMRTDQILRMDRRHERAAAHARDDFIRTNSHTE